MLKGGTNQHDFVLVEIHFSFNLNNFHSLEVVDRVSETKNEMNRALGHLCAHIG